MTFFFAILICLAILSSFEKARTTLQNKNQIEAAAYQNEIELFSDSNISENTHREIADSISPIAKKIEQLKSEYSIAGQVYEYLNTQGMSDAVIAGILGNMMAECGGQTLDLQWDVYGFDDDNYYGLCQWSLYYNPSIDGADVTTQLDYLMGNIRTNMDYFGGSYDIFCTITDPGDAARYFCNYYEIGAGESVRASNAETAFAWIQGE